jgi:hypothetical protein
MTHQERAMATDRLRRGILAFQAAESLFLNAHRRMKIQPQVGIDAYWAGPGQQIKEELRIAATEVDDAFKAFSAAGLGVGVADQRSVIAAQRYLVELT